MRKVLFSWLTLTSLAMACGCGISVEHAYMKTPAGENTAAYMIIKNDGDKPRKLESAEITVKKNGETINVAKRIELHKHEENKGAMQMRKVEFFDVPAKGQADLLHTGNHIMLFGVDKKALEGVTEADATLYFEDGGEQKVTLPIKNITVTN